MRTSTKRILSIAVAALFLIGTLLVYLNLIRPEVKDVSLRRALVASKENLFRNQQQAVGQVQDSIAKFRNVAAFQETVALAMPSGSETIGALRQVEAIARASGATLASLDFKVIAPRSSATESFIKKLGVVEVNVSVQGGYEALKRFLELLETGVRVTNIKEFKYQPVGTRASPDALAVTAEVYYQE